MTISRGQMDRQLRMGGGIMDVVPREKAIFGGIKRAAKKVVKKATGAVKDIASSDLGKAALLYGATAGLGALGAGKGFGSLLQGSTYLPNSVLGNLGASATNLFKGRALGVDKFDNIIRGQSGIDKLLGTVTGGGIKGNIGKIATLTAVSGFLTKTLGMTPEQAEEELSRDPSTYLRQYYTNLNPNASEEEITEFVTTNTSEYAVGGRVGFAEGPVLPPDPTQPVNPFGPKPPADAPVLPDRMASNTEVDKAIEALFEKYLEMGLSPKEAMEKVKEDIERMGMSPSKVEGRGLAAIGGKMDSASDNAMQAASIEGLPIRQNPKGVKELDLRNTGGFIQPVGIKEKEDDIPAMLSNNEFVFTADAVRGMGEGNVNVGAQRMYDMMKKLEAGGRV
jgi:hypothetical protein